MFKTVLFFVSILSVLSAGDASKILGVFPTPSISHQVVFRVLTQELARRGHEVVIITTDPLPKEETPSNLTQIDLHDLSYEYTREFLSNQIMTHKAGAEFEWVWHIDDIMLFIRSILEEQLKSDKVQEFLQKNEKFDLLLIEAYMRPALIFSHLFKAPVIQVSSFGAMLENLEAVGASTHPTLYPVPYRHRLYNLSLWEKLQEYYYHLQIMFSLKTSVTEEDEMLRRVFGANIPSIDELVNNVDVLFLNVHAIWMDNQPMPPNVVFMGGLHQKPQKELPQDLKSYLDSSKNGVVYVSFGTNVHPIMFPPERLKALTGALSELPYDVLFKWNDDELPGRTENIRISKWFPQSDLLRHPKIKAFVMQGGLQSTDEAITAGVPLVCIPMLGDQWYNAEKYEKFKIGLKLYFRTFTKSQLKNAIETVITDESYRQNIAKLRDVMNDEPQSPLERAVWWVDYTLRNNGAKHLRAPAANMSWADYCELNLILTIFMSATVLFSIVVYGIVRLLRLIRISHSNKVKRS